MSNKITIKEIAKVTNGKSDVKDAVDNGKYVFFDRSILIKKSNTYLLDSEAIIIPGEDSRQIFEPRYFYGKFNLHQRCYVIYDFSENFSPKYLYYKLKTLTKHFANVNVGSTVPSLRLDHITDLIIDFPNYTTQKSIAKVLSDLDAKIELNNKINRELESMAKTLYDYWFVQFDFPDANGRPYKSSGGKMVYNAELKREIPEGWEVKPINTKVKIGSGFPFNSDDYSDTGKYKIITIKNVQEGYLETSSVDYVSFLPNNISAFCILKEGDILMSLTGNVGRMCFVDQSNLLLNQRVGKLLGEKDFVTYAYFFFKRPENQKRLEKIAGGSSQANLSPIDAVKDKFPIPTASVLNNFTQLVNPLLNQILIKNQENQHLTSLRDWLLPMLMNGQVTVKENQ